MSASAPPIGVLGGSFDPVHVGHLRLAEDALSALGLGSIRWVPSGVPGHREEAHASAADRLRMLELALQGEPRYSIDTSELDADEPTYTVNTLARLRAELGLHVPLVFIMGADQLLVLDTWREWTRLPSLAHFGVGERPGYPVRPERMSAVLAAEYGKRRSDAAALRSAPCGRIVVFPMRPTDLSSTALREELRHAGGASAGVPAAVLDYIHSKGLYR